MNDRMTESILWTHSPFCGCITFSPLLFSPYPYSLGSVREERLDGGGSGGY